MCRCVLVFGVVCLATDAMRADVFSIPTGQTSIQFVTVGDPHNAADTRYSSAGVGSVASSYRIGKHEVTARQYAAFLNAVAKTDPYGLYAQSMDYTTYPSSHGCNIVRTGASGNYTYSVASDWANRPVNFVSWGDAARFANWLQNGQPTTGAENASTTEDGAYSLNGATSTSALTAVTRNSGASYWIPSEDEWYKAAYYDPNKPGGAGYWDYPTQSNTAPVNTLVSPDPGNHANFYDGIYTMGTPYYRTEVGSFANSSSAYGTLDQGGNVWEWNETPVWLAQQHTGWTRVARGGDSEGHTDGLVAGNPYYYDPILEATSLGFRVASLPEPSASVLASIATISLLIYGWPCRRR